MIASRVSTFDDLSDSELLVASRSDATAFGVFYDRHARGVLAYVYSRTACPHTAADVTAEAFPQAFHSRTRYRDTGAPPIAWLFAIVRHELSRTMRRRRTDGRALRRLGIERIAMDDESLEHIERLDEFEGVKVALSAGLPSLGPSTAEALRLRVLEGLSYADVSKQLGCSVGAARVRVARGLQKLARKLEAEA